MIIYLNGHFRNWDYVDKHISRLRNRGVVEYRIKVLKFWDEHGLDAALDYAKDLNLLGKCSGATLYRWKKNLADSGKQDRMGRCSLSAIDPKNACASHCRLPRNYDELYGPIRHSSHTVDPTSTI